MDPILLVVGGGALLAYLNRRKAATQPDEEKPPEQAKPEEKPGGGFDAKDLGIGALVTLAGGAFGGAYAKDFVSKQNAPDTQTYAPLIGAGTSAAVFAGVGGLAGAGALAGGSVLLAAGIILIPSIALIAIVLSTAGAIESKIRMARFRELYEQINGRLFAKDYMGAWKIAVQGKEEGFAGLGWSGGGIPENFQGKDGNLYPVAATMKAAYAESIARGREYAHLIQQSWPWMNVYKRDSKGVVIGLMEFIPAGAKMIDNRGRRLRAIYEPGFRETEGLAPLEPIRYGSEAYKAAKAEAKADAIEKKTGGKYA